METYFIRHNNSLDEETRKSLLKKHCIFIHYPWDKKTGKHWRFDSRSTNPDDYGSRGAKTALHALNKLADSGGDVCAHFPERSQWLLGFVRPQRIQLARGKWNEKPSKQHNGVAIVKTLRLSKQRFVESANFVLLQTVQPRQGTIVRWHKAKDLVKALVLRRRLKPAFDLLADEHQDLLCAEFLRTRLARKFGLPQLECLLCDIGRTMKDLDIFGLATNGKKIFGQVTHDTPKQVTWKIDALKKYEAGSKNHLILFCDSDTQENRGKVIIFPIREVYRNFTSTSAGERWLKNIFQS